MRLICASDLHGSGLMLMYIAEMAKDYSADVIILAGDLTVHPALNASAAAALYEAVEYAKVPIICTLGNHDKLDPRLFFPRVDLEKKLGIICLIEESYIYKGLKFWGSPYVPYINGTWAYEKQLKHLYYDFPSETDVLITHAPPYGYGDQLSDGTRTGSEELTKSIDATQGLKAAIFGHIHSSAGWQGRINETTLCNVACLDDDFKPKFEAVTRLELI